MNLNIFNLSQISAAKEYFDQNGFCGFNDLFDAESFKKVTAAVNESIDSGQLVIGDTELESNNDVIYAHPAINDLCKNDSIVNIAKTLIGCAIELQHAKFNAKPKENSGGGAIPWHQDYPFFPHSNFDLIACVIHLDDEDEASGPMEFITGSHKLGPVRHTDNDGNFAYECTDARALSSGERVLMAVKKGTVTFHHGLAIHRSGLKRNMSERRLIVFQYRAYDAVQLAGVIWKCNGEHVDKSLPLTYPAVARFPNGQSVELRGIGGRLYDPMSRLAPNKSKTTSSQGEYEG